jgi:hypothetical protein
VIPKNALNFVPMIDHTKNPTVIAALSAGLASEQSIDMD